MSEQTDKSSAIQSLLFISQSLFMKQLEPFQLSQLSLDFDNDLLVYLSRELWETYRLVPGIVTAVFKPTDDSDSHVIVVVSHPSHVHVNSIK
jgi:hypothetical protein